MPKIHVSRSEIIQASPEKVFNAVSDFATWTTWSPWLCAEPDANVDVSDDSNSVGSTYDWDGEIVGAGGMQHTLLNPGSRIECDLSFLRPFKSTAKVAFDFKPEGDGTKISWSMDSSLPFFLFWMKNGMESMIGMDYERGLKLLKEWLETGEILSKTKIRGVEEIGPIHMVGVRKICSMDDIGASMETAFNEGVELANAKQLNTCGERMAVYHCVDLKNQTFDYTAGFVVPDVVDGANGLSTWSIPRPSKAVAVEHTGSYENLGNPWSAAYSYVRYKKLKQSNDGTFEVYKNDPQETSPADLKTEIFLPLR